jgi:hypothetical protein
MMSFLMPNDATPDLVLSMYNSSSTFIFYSGRCAGSIPFAFGRVNMEEGGLIGL